MKQTLLDIHLIAFYIKIVMKAITYKLLILSFVFFTAGIALSNAAAINSLNINTSQDIVIVSEYQCRISNANCVVDRIKYVQTGAVYYDGECGVDFVKKADYERYAIDDVQNGYFKYCSMSSRTLKSNSSFSH